MLATTIYPPPQIHLDNLFDATDSILEQAFAIASQKQELSHQEYKKLLSKIGWSLRESKIYLKVANAFSNFTANDLKEVEPHTIFELAKHAKKYNQVIESLKHCSHITQEKVRELITAHRTPKKPKPDKPTIWKTGRDGEPVCRIPDIMEEDMQTGSIIQQEMDANGIIPQTLIREAIALWNDIKKGRLAVVENEVNKEGDNNVNKNVERDSTNQDNTRNMCELNTIFADNSTSEELNISDSYHNTISTIDEEYERTLNGLQTHILTTTDVVTEEANHSQPSISNINIISNLPTTNGLIKLENQNTFSSSEQENIEQNMKIFGDEISLQVDDMVIWDKCPPQYHCWQPFQIQDIKENMVQVDLLNFLIPIDELTKSSDENLQVDR